MPTFNIQVITEADILAGGGTVGSNGTFATADSTFTYSEATMPWHTMQIVDNGSDTTTLSSDTDPTNSDGGANAENEGVDGEIGTLLDPDGNAIGSSGGVAADRWGVLSGSDGSTIFIYEIENFDDTDVYAFSAPLVDGVTYTTTTQNTRDQPIEYGQMVCLARGTRVLTPSGYCEIETLSVGSEVMTVDHGAQQVRWIARSKYKFPAERGGSKTHPVRIRARAAGNTKCLLVSPQHRVAVRLQAADAFHDAFVPAKMLAEEYSGSIRYAYGVRQVEFFNLLLDRHEVIYAEGAQVESLYPGKETRTVPWLGLAVLAHPSTSALWSALTATEIEEAYGPLARKMVSRSALRRAISTGRLSFPSQAYADAS